MMAEPNTGRRSLRHALVACCLLGAGGCEIIRDPTAIVVDDGPVAVHAMLVAGERRVAVLVTRYESVDQASGMFGPAYRLVPVAGADVRVASGGRSITLAAGAADEDCFTLGDPIVTETPDSLAPGCYTGATDAIVPGAQYQLNITLPDGTAVTGEAEVPAPVVVRTPNPGATIEVRTWYDPADLAPPHPLAWTGTQPDHALKLRLEADTEFLDPGTFGLEGCRRAWTPQELDVGLQEPQAQVGFVPGLFDRVMLSSIDLTARDSADIDGWYLFCDGPLPTELDGTLQLAVFDLEYALYLDRLARSESILLEDASAGVSGAVGVFTATAITRLPVRLLVPPDSAPSGSPRR